MKTIRMRVWYADENEMLFPEVVRTESICNDGGIWMLGTTKMDRNNIEIFDGDIVSFDFITKHNVTRFTGKIFFDEFMWCVETDEEEVFSINRITNVEVIGNVYQTAELFKANS